ncbi:MAG TPA: FHA domain-containing protein [Gemmatimonadaceae bacterium]|nr:FHA domain-containing protein [Gemmatimonadaceae bacterium]
MPILLTEREQCELLAGNNSIGGDAPDSVRLSQLSTYPLVGIITVSDDAPPTIQRLSSRVALALNGAMLGAAPSDLTEGAIIQVGNVRMTYYAHAAAAEAAAPGVPRRRKESELATQVITAIGAPTRPAALIALDSGRIFRLATRDLVIGRSEDADVVLTGKGVSRRHALICADGSGYALADESTNGTFINGTRVSGTTPLNPGDTIAFGDEHYRFDYIDPALAARLNGGTATRANGMASAPLAELEIVRGRGDRTLYAIDRPVCALGRGTHNDVSVDDESVAASHATLLLKGDTWYLTDLRSVNGTYVDGYRVAGERALAAGSVIRLGQVAMAFWPTGARKPDAGTRAAGGVLRKLARTLFFGG